MPKRPGSSLGGDVRRILFLHLAGVSLQGVGQALVLILPFLARKQFDAANWQSWVLTAAVPVMQFFTIFWNHFYARVSTNVYLLVVSALACTPFALMGLADDMGLIMVCLVVAAFAGAGGGAALSPINADLLRACYPDQVRGRVYGFVAAAQFTGVIVAGWIMGEWSDLDPRGYRFFMPLTALAFGGSMLLYARIGGSARFGGRPRSGLGDEPWWSALRGMGRILRTDRRFAAYEIAFMSYGVGWMICSALVPLLANDRLGLGYFGYARSVVVTLQVTMILLLVPMGRLADRVGAVRLAAASFLWLTIYPLGLLWVPSEFWLGLFTVLYAVGMVGVHLTWTLGPVAFAPEPSKAPHYLAVHGTLVGVRGIVVQGVGVWLYSLTGGFTVPMLLGTLGFAWAAWRMRRLAREMDAPGGGA
ncbi:MAG: hypothetical protein ACE5E1_03110 [Phycisphaerae bacterium]